jgi:CubicO group peptidase (beta-lactamase class C family)
MPQIKAFIQELQKATGKASLPVKFWKNYSDRDAHTFQEVLNQYAEYCRVYLNSAQKKAMSRVFWTQIEAIGTPIIEAIPGSEDTCGVYFLFPKARVNAGNDVYLQGDFHSYGTTKERARLEHLENTDIMLKHNVMTQDDWVVYQFVQLPQSIQNKTPTELAGSRFVEPPQTDYFPKQTPAVIDTPPTPDNPPNWYENPEVILREEYSKHRPVFFVYGEDRIFRVNPDKMLARLPGEPLDWQALLSKTVSEDKPFVLHDVFYSNIAGDIHPREHIPPDQFFQNADKPPYDKLTRVIYVVKPKTGAVEDLVLINDGLGYLHSGAMQQFEQMVDKHRISPQTGFILVNTLPALAETMRPPEGNEKASLAGMGERTLDYEYGKTNYVNFMRDQLFPQLKVSGFAVPTDKNHRVMLGSSLSGTFAVWVASEHPELFGTVIAQSPSPANRSILRDVVRTYDASAPRANIILSCGKFEAPSFAANDNLGYAEQLSRRLGIPLQVGPHGHQFLPWTEELARDLPKAMHQNHEQAQLNTLIERHDVVGASVAVLENGDIHAFSAGKLAAGEEQVLTPGGVFEAASLSKPVFAYIVLKMVERGEIDLDTPLCQLSLRGFGPPELRETPQYQKITARMILSHQTGLPNWMPEAFQAEPQTQFNYSGLAYCFLCDVIHEISGQSLEQLAKRELEPLGIVQSSYFYQPLDGSGEKRRFAVGHNVDGASDKQSHYPRISEVNAQGNTYLANPAASLFITAENHAKFLTACVNDAFIREHMFVSVNDLGNGRDQKALQEGVSPQVLANLHWGLGIGIQENEDGSKTLFHWGDSETFRNLIALRLAKDGSYQGVVCLTNSAHGPAVFRQISEPIVGSIEPIATWLRTREKLNVSAASFTTRAEEQGMCHTNRMRGQLQALKSEETKADVPSSSQRGDIPGITGHK